MAKTASYAQPTLALNGACILGLPVAMRRLGRFLGSISPAWRHSRFSVHGTTLFVRSDSGPEFVSHAILEWIAQSGIATALSDPGKT